MHPSVARIVFHVSNLKRDLVPMPITSVLADQVDANDEISVAVVNLEDKVVLKGTGMIEFDHKRDQGRLGRVGTTILARYVISLSWSVL